MMLNSPTWILPERSGSSLMAKMPRLAQDAALRLAPQAERDEVVARQERVHELRDDRVLVAHDAREQRRAVLEQADEVLPQLVLDRTVNASGTRPFGLSQLAESGWLGHMAIVNRPAAAV